MKILHLLYESKGDYFGIGGAGIRAYEIYYYLKKKHDITLLCKKYPGAADGHIDGLKHVFVGTESHSLTKSLLSYACHAALFVKKYGKEFDVIIEEFSPAIPSFSNVFTKKPVILQVQGYTGRFYFRKYNPLYASTLYLMEHIRPLFYDNFIFMTGETIKRLSLEKLRCAEIIPNGVSPALFGRVHTESKYILYLGRIDIHHKGLDILLNAYARFLESFPDIELVIAGDGRDMDKFLAVIHKLPEAVRKNIQLPGWVEGDKKIDLIRRASFVVFPSRYEVQPIAVLEAMAQGKAVVVSDIPEFSFVTEKRAGISFKSGNEVSLSASIAAMLTASQEERQEMGLRGRDWVSEFTWDKIAKRFEKFLYSVVDKQ